MSEGLRKRWQLSILTPVVQSSVRSTSLRRSERKEVTIFLAYLSFMLSRIRREDFDEYIRELNDAVQQQYSSGCTGTAPSSPTTCTRHEPVAYHDSNYQRSLLEEIAGRALRYPNAVEKEIKTNRFVTAFCHLKIAHEKAEETSRNASKLTRTAEMIDLLSYDILHASENTSEKLDFPAMLQRVKYFQPKAKEDSSRLAVTRNLFISSKNLLSSRL